MSEFKLPYGMEKKPDGRLVKKEYIPARTEEREVDLKQALHDVLLEKIMNWGEWMGEWIQWHCVSLAPAVTFFEKASAFTREFGLDLKDVAEGLPEEVRQACDERDRLMVQRAIKAGKKSAIERTDYYGIQPAFKPLAAVELLGDYLSGKLTVDTVSKNMFDDQSPYEKEFQRRLAQIHQQRIDFVKRLEGAK